MRPRVSAGLIPANRLITPAARLQRGRVFYTYQIDRLMTVLIVCVAMSTKHAIRHGSDASHHWHSLRLVTDAILVKHSGPPSRLLPRTNVVYMDIPTLGAPRNTRRSLNDQVQIRNKRLNFFKDRENLESAHVFSVFTYTPHGPRHVYVATPSPDRYPRLWLHQLETPTLQWVQGTSVQNRNNIPAGVRAPGLTCSA